MSKETEPLERSPWPGDEESRAGFGSPVRGRVREPAPPMAVGDAAEVALQLDRRLAQCRRQRAVLSLVHVVVERIAVDGGPPTAELAREVHDEVAHRMRGRVRSTDGVVRQGESQTCAILCGGTADTARRVADRYAAALNGAYRLAAGRADVSVRIGFAAYPHDGVRAVELLHRAAGLPS